MQPEAVSLLSHSDHPSCDDDGDNYVVDPERHKADERPAIHRRCHCSSGDKMLLAALAVALAIGLLAGGITLIAKPSGQSSANDAMFGHLIAKPVRCAANEFQCDSGVQCVASHEVCDGIGHCYDMSDENKCPSCPTYRFDCGGGTGQCIRREWRCDREFDCDNRADEEGCDTCNATAGMYTCENYQCVPAETVCDGIDNCGDSSDEAFCVNTTDAGLLLVTTHGSPSGSLRPQPRPVCYQPSIDWSKVAGNLCALVGRSHLNANVSCVAALSGSDTVYAHLAEVASAANYLAQGIWPSAHSTLDCPSGQVATLHCQECGKAKSLYRHKRVIGGRPTSVRKWPWFVRLLVGGSELCGGTLISDRHVLTAAHCFDKSGDSELVLDSDDLLGDGGWRAVGKRVHLHPRYQASGAIKRYDFAVVEISPTAATMELPPVCLPRAWERDSFKKPTKCYVIGFGRIFHARGKAFYPRKLQEAKVKIFSKAECQLFYKDNHVDMEDDMQCAGSDTNGVDTCEGDSGGPLVCLRRGSWWLVGVTSWGFRCGSGTPSIYASVADVLPWLLSVLDLPP